MEELEHRITSLEEWRDLVREQIAELKGNNDILHSLATSMEVMVTKQAHMSEKVDKIDNKVEALEAKPGKRYDGIIEKVILMVVAAIVTFALTKVGL